MVDMQSINEAIDSIGNAKMSLTYADCGNFDSIIDQLEEVQAELAAILNRESK